jgi:virginiamycin B lyase
MGRRILLKILRGFEMMVSEKASRTQSLCTLCVLVVKLSAYFGHSVACICALAVLLAAALLSGCATGDRQATQPTVPAADERTGTIERAPTADARASTAAEPAPITAPRPIATAAPPTTSTPAAVATPECALALQEYAVPRGAHPHDVAPAPDGSIWYTAQAAGALGRLDPATGETHQIKLGDGSAPHGVIVGPDGAPWITDGGLNAILRVDPATEQVRRFPLPPERPRANLNTAVFDRQGVLWFTGQGGIYGRLDPASGTVAVFDAPRGAGPYGITATPDGSVYYASLAGNHIARIDPATAAATVIEPPTAGQGARRV